MSTGMLLTLRKTHTMKYTVRTLLLISAALLTPASWSADNASPAAASSGPAKGGVFNPHTGMVKPAETGPIKVAKAAGPNAYTVTEVVTKAVALKDKPVVVNGKVVKYNAGIMGKNWIHLRDGTGTEASNDILVTTAAQAKLGDVLTVSGVVRNDKDFGAGYLYKVLIEEATLTAIK